MAIRKGRRVSSDSFKAQRRNRAMPEGRFHATQLGFLILKSSPSLGHPTSANRDLETWSGVGAHTETTGTARLRLLTWAIAPVVGIGGAVRAWTISPTYDGRLDTPAAGVDAVYFRESGHGQSARPVRHGDVGFTRLRATSHWNFIYRIPASQEVAGAALSGTCSRKTQIVVGRKCADRHADIYTQHSSDELEPHCRGKALVFSGSILPTCATRSGAPCRSPSTFSQSAFSSVLDYGGRISPRRTVQ